MNFYNTTYLNNISSMGLLTDRVLDEDIELPYSYDDIKIKPNASLNSTTFNNSIELLNHNFLYIASYGKLPDTTLPFNQTNKMILLGEDNPFFLDIEVDVHSSDYSLLSAQDAAFTRSKDNKMVAGAIATRDKLIMLHYDAETEALKTNLVSIAISNEQIKSNSSRIYSDSTSTDSFENIKKLEIDDNRDLFVLDDTKIYKFDISTIATTQQAALRGGDSFTGSTSGRQVTLTLGGAGNVNSTSNFNNPKSFSINGTDIYVLDQQSDNQKAFVKRYDTNFNFKNIYNISTDLAQLPGVDLLANENNIFVLTVSGNIIEYDTDFKLIKNHEPVYGDYIGDSDIYTRIKRSGNNDNTFYVATTGAVMKKYKSKPDRNVSKYTTSGGDFSFISIVPSYLGTYDEILIGDRQNNGRMYRFLDKPNFRNAFSDTYQTEIFELSALKIDPNENVNHFVYNKAFSKLLYNHFVLKEGYKSKFSGRYDSEGLKFNILRYPLDEEFASTDYATSKSNYIGMNEIILSETVNRPIKQLHDLQELMLDSIKEKRVNVYPLSSMIVGLS